MNTEYTTFKIIKRSCKTRNSVFIIPATAIQLNRFFTITIISLFIIYIVLFCFSNVIAFIPTDVHVSLSFQSEINNDLCTYKILIFIRMFSTITVFIIYYVHT